MGQWDGWAGNELALQAWGAGRRDLTAQLPSAHHTLTTARARPPNSKIINPTVRMVTSWPLAISWRPTFQSSCVWGSSGFTIWVGGEETQHASIINIYCTWELQRFIETMLVKDFTHTRLLKFVCFIWVLAKWLNWQNRHLPPSLATWILSPRHDEKSELTLKSSGYRPLWGFHSRYPALRYLYYNS